MGNYVSEFSNIITTYATLLTGIATIVVATAAVFYTLWTRRIMTTAQRTLDKDIKSLIYSAIYTSYDNLYSNLIKESEIRSNYFRDASKDGSYCFFEILYSLIARVWKFYKSGDLSKSEWELWEEWIKTICKNDLFVRVHNCNKNLYDKQFRDMIDKLNT